MILYATYFVTITLLSGIHLYKAPPNYQPDDLDEEELPLKAKLLWILTNITLVVGGVIVVIFWSFLFHISFTATVARAFDSINVHAVVYSLVLIDCIAFQMIPIRLFHIIYPIAFSLVYLIMSVIYTIVSDRSIYPIIDWNSNPGGGVLYCFLAMLLATVFQLIFYAIYRLKCRCQSRIQE